ncbi:hypothetical protein DV096_19530 [Bradymonadaceae bacterium TMQ3]|nr:hypothetical protein DV096_19530 [Bradymonadaceae bacterium TMQ3]TXC68496.1 hypothetical protein FRC91_19315 [Bradymonadales bacterium TMQ1]
MAGSSRSPAAPTARAAPATSTTPTTRAAPATPTSRMNPTSPPDATSSLSPRGLRCRCSTKPSSYAWNGSTSPRSAPW